MQDDYLVASGEFCRTIISWRVESFAGRLSSDGMQPLVFFNVELVNYRYLHKSLFEKVEFTRYGVYTNPTVIRYLYYTAANEVKQLT